MFARLVSSRRRSLRRQVVRTSSLARRGFLGRRAAFETLENRALLARDFLEAPNDTFPGQAIEHVPGAGYVVHSVSSGATIVNGDADYYSFAAAVAGDVTVRLTNQGGDPSVDGPGDVGLVLERYDGGGALQSTTPVAVVGGQGEVVLPTTAGTSFWFAVRGATAGSDAKYSLAVWNRDVEDDAGGPTNNTLGTATALGNEGSIVSAALLDHTITSPDRDFYSFTAAEEGLLVISAVMPTNTGVATTAGPSGPFGPTNLGIRVRNAAGTVLASSNATQTAVDTASLATIAGATYFVEIYSGSLGQVNRYDLTFDRPGAPTGAISGWKFNDLNGDGFWGEDEPGIGGVSITLDVNDDGDATPDVTVVTQESPAGYYEFSAVPYGTHRLTETVPVGFYQTWPDLAGDYVVQIGPDARTLDHLDFGNREYGRIIVEKQALPDGSSQSFTFTPSYDDDFDLADGQTNDSGYLTPGTYTVQELLPTGWFLEDVEFVTSDGTDTSSWDVDTATIDLDPGETITVRFRDTQYGRIIVEKQTLPDGSSESFTFAPSYGADFDLTDGQTNDSGDLAPGSYSVQELLPAGWMLADVEFLTSDGSDSSTWDVSTATIDLDPGETITVRFRDTQQGRIVVEKQTLPDGSESSFTFAPSYDDDFDLSDGQQNDSGYLAPGSYSVQELVPSGWSLTDVEFVTSDGSDTSSWTTDTATIDLDPGETITVRFSNTQQGRIIVEKQTLPDGSESSFTFDSSYDVDFDLSDDQSNDSGYLAPGSYSVAELVPSGWSLTDVEFVTSDGADTSSWTVDTATIDLDAGETITVRFNNTQYGRIIVEKQTLPDGSSQSFTFDSSYGADFDLTDGQTNDSGYLAPGSYSVQELLPTGWFLADVEFVTSDGADTSSWDVDTATIDLDPGETITVRFRDTQYGRIIVEKQTLPDGSSESFTFDPSYGADFDLTDGQTNDSGDLAPGSYSVQELLPAGWSLTDVEFVTSDGTDSSSWDVDTATIDLDPGETITVRFHDTQLGRIIVEKQTLPDGGQQSFTFTPSYDVDFDLTDGQQNDSGYLAPGSYSVQELVPSGWSLTDVEFVTSDGSDSSSWTTDTATIDLDPGETITVRFSNTQLGRIIVEKQTLPDGSSQSFTFTPSYDVDFDLSDDQTNDSGYLAPGSYSVAELVPSGWSLTDVEFVTSDGADTSSWTVDTATIDLDAGETITVRFRNTQYGRIIVEKQTLPDGSSQSFTFDSSYDADFDLTDGQTNDSGYLAPGSYSVQELLPTGWFLADIEFVTSDGADTSSWDVDTATIDLDPGETITVRFRDTQYGRIIVEKQTLPDGSSETFTFDSNYGADFDLTDGQTNDSGDLAPGSYSVQELLPAGWMLADVEFVTSDGADSSSWDVDTATIDLDPGETITVRFRDTQLGRIIVEKQTLPDGSSQSFTFSPSYGGNFPLTDDQQNDSGYLAPGSYSVQELVPSGWSLTDVEFVTSDGSDSSSWTTDTATIDLDPGETITVRFSNTQLGRIIVEKQTLPDGSSQSFTFSPSYDDDFNLTDGQQNDSGYLAPGSYSVAELVPSGWSLTDVEFVTSDGADTSSWTVDTATIDLDAGETITVRFSNTQYGRIIVEKQTLPDGSSQSFTFDSSYDADFDLTDGQTNDSGYLAPGSYSVQELLPTGWFLADVEFVTSDGADTSSWTVDTATIDLDPGETITVRFRDTQYGRIIVEKQTLPDGSSQSFTFTPSYDDDFDLTDGQTNDSGYLAPGSYSVQELVPSGWMLANVVFTTADGTDSSNWSIDTATIDLDPGETITVRFEDTQLGKIIVEKQTTPDGSPQSFTFTRSYGANFGLTDGQQHDSGYLAPGSYSVTELATAGWTLSGVAFVTDDGGDTSSAAGSTATIDLDPGETMLVRFSNELTPAVTGRKYYDANRNGTDDGGTDMGLAGWTMRLYRDVNNNNTYEPNIYVGGVLLVTGADGDPIATAVTDSTGVYKLGSVALPTGRVFVAETLQQGWTQTSAPAVYSFIHTANVGDTGIDFGNASCTDTLNVMNGSTSYVAANRGIVTVELIGGGTFTVAKGGGSFTSYTGAGTAVTGTSAASRSSEYAPRETGRQRVDVLANVGDTFQILVSGASPGATLRIVNSVNVAAASTLSLQITGTACGETIFVADDANFGATSDAKRIYIGATLGTYDAGVDLAFTGVEYDAALINAMFGNPTLSRIDINALGGDDVVRIADDSIQLGAKLTQQSTIIGGDGNDVIRAGAGRSTITAGAGHDFVVGSSADDTIYAGAGNDYVHGLDGADSVDGEDGDDWIAGGAGDDPLLRGGNGNDRISGGAGRDRLLGDAGAANVAYRDSSDLSVTGFTLANILSVPPNADAVEIKLNDMIDRVWQDHYLSNGNDDASLDTLDELFAWLLP